MRIYVGFEITPGSCRFERVAAKPSTAHKQTPADVVRFRCSHARRRPRRQRNVYLVVQIARPYWEYYIQIKVRLSAAHSNSSGQQQSAKPSTRVQQRHFTHDLSVAQTRICTRTPNTKHSCCIHSINATVATTRQNTGKTQWNRHRAPSPLVQSFPCRTACQIMHAFAFKPLRPLSVYVQAVNGIRVAGGLCSIR